MDPIDILLVEDDEDQIALFRALARKCSVPTRIHVAQNGLDAMQFLWGTEETQASTRPRLVLLDLNLPELDGRTLLSEIRAHPGLAKVPVVVLTASEDTQDVMHAYDHQARGFLKKPLVWEDLDAVLRNVANGAKGWA